VQQAELTRMSGLVCHYEIRIFFIHLPSTEYMMYRQGLGSGEVVMKCRHIYEVMLYVPGPW
jgi:hypothetical protein